MSALAARGIEVIDGGGGGNFLRTALFRWNADLYHFHWLHPYLLRPQRASTILRATRFLIELLLLRLRGGRFVWTIHNLANHERLFPAIERFFSTIVARLVDGVIVHSGSGRLEATRTYRLPARTPIAVIPQGSYVDHYRNQTGRRESRAELGLDVDEFVFLFLGRIEPYKGVPELIRAFRQLRSASRLVIAGRASDSALASRIREEAASARNVRFDEGYVPDEKLQVYFNAADVFVLPVKAILHSSSIALATSFGLPCIAPAFEGIKAVLGEDGGILYQPEAPHGLLRAMELAINMRETLLETRARILKRARAHTWTAAAETTEALYRAAMGSSGTP